jgi:ABC-type multidrug transport system fused ATPase/permease subunit
LASDIAVQFEGVSASRGGRRVLEDVSIAIGAGEVVALVGRSGSGKTTLLRLINRLIEPDQGDVIVDGRLDQRVGSDRAAP